MGYDYQTQRPWLFTEEGQLDLLKTRDHIQCILKVSGAVMMANCFKGLTGDSWNMLAIVDRLVEIGDLREIKYGLCAAQHRIFVAQDIPAP